jgi:hypothetical protein
MNLTIKILGIVFLLGIGTTNAQTYFHPYGTPNISNLQNKGEMQVAVSGIFSDGKSGISSDINYAIYNRFFLTFNLNYLSGSFHEDYSSGRGFFGNGIEQKESNINTHQTLLDFRIGRSDFHRVDGCELANFYYNASLGLNFGQYVSKETIANYLDINKNIFGITSLLNVGFSSKLFDFFIYYEIIQNNTITNKGYVKAELPELYNEYYQKDVPKPSYFTTQGGVGVKIGYKWVKIQMSLGTNSTPKIYNSLFDLGPVIVAKGGLSVDLFNKRNKEGLLK